MKRARVNTRSEAARARARPCPVSPDALLALLDDTDVTVGQLCASFSALASLTADLVARNDESLKLAVAARVASSRSALLSLKARVLGSAKWLSRKQSKMFDAALETADVTRKQLRVWAAVAGAGTVRPDVVIALDSALALLTALPQFQARSVDMGSLGTSLFPGELGSVVICDGLRVVSAAGPGLKWFEPHSRNEFIVVLAQADGSVPVWLTADDVAVCLLAPIDAADTGATAAAVQSGSTGTVRVVYGWLSEDAPEAVLQLSVCGVAVADAADGSNWGVHVPQKPLAGHECAAVGKYVRALAVMEGSKNGMAVSADEKWLVVGLQWEGTLSVYSLPEGALVRTFGGRGDGPLQFKQLLRLCFAPNGNLIVVDSVNRRLQEVTLEGVFIRCIGVGEFDDGQPCSVAVHDDVIAVGCCLGTDPRVLLFDLGTGSTTSRFGELGTGPGQLSLTCTGIQFTHDGSHVIVAEYPAARLSLFTATGVFVKLIGVGVLGGGAKDLLQSVSGEYVVTDSFDHRVCVFSPDGLELVRSWGVRGVGDGQFQYPIALAAAGRRLYVMDAFTVRVQLFE